MMKLISLVELLEQDLMHICLNTYSDTIQELNGYIRPQSANNRCSRHHHFIQ